MNALRLATGTLVLLAGAALLYSLFVEPRPAPVQAASFESSRACQECHAEVYAEWESSWHAKSWVDDEFRRLSDEYSNTDCIDCHAPRPVLETGIGNRVLLRTARRVDGVDCLSCHMRADGRIAGTIDNPSAACRPVATRDLIVPEFCASCHDQHKTVQQWKASRFAVPGPGYQSCVDCHMPPRDPDDPSRGRDHTMHGGHDLALLQRAVELRGAREGDGYRVEIENVGAGHNYPTDERSRASDVFWRELTAGEPGPWQHAYRFRNPYRYEGLPDTELPAGETQVVPIPGVQGPIEVALFYKLSPYWKDPERPDPEGEATLVHSLVLSP